ncbi:MULTISPECIES: hypothetical protein [unclassified Thiobacillus]|uniref:hypothetical protein n=1 Tax=unclassified Thiobacillus TaxID=2646513 RepID=UPI00086CBA8E|nr:MULTISPECIES: hypothetical protein [unclassified Thiobacillus]MBN8779571.1 hypothetical protein [Thiobacillus sp.]ODV00286.1 MAG: hypothetical protein ABT23_11770 [Thiobacillus sp. SCN 63-57]
MMDMPDNPWAERFTPLLDAEEIFRRATQILLSMSYLGLPMVNIANFSLVHKLMQRPQEDRQRLLAKPCVLVPDSPESQDWIQTLATYRAVASDVLVYDPVNDAKYIFLLSAGIKRLVVRLLVLGYRISRKLRGHVATVKRE